VLHLSILSASHTTLSQYQKEHGDCRVHTRTELGRWVLNQRISRNQNSSTLTEKRINLLDSLGFIWCAKPEGWAAKPAGGDPRQNRAIAAKMMYPDLLIRECLLLGGYEEEELNVVKNPKHAWRTGELELLCSFVCTILL
jgi:hypothetical protein